MNLHELPVSNASESDTHIAAEPNNTTRSLQTDGLFQ